MMELALTCINACGIINMMAAEVRFPGHLTFCLFRWADG